MSETVDTKIVELRLDAEQFTEKIRESLDSLSSLNVSLNNMNTDIDMSGAESQLEIINRKLSFLGVAAATVAQDITRYFEQAFVKAAGFLKQGVWGGGLTRAMNIEQARFQIEGLDGDWKKLSDDINYGVKDTAYGFDEAAKAASMFYASGIKEGDKMKGALRGISGVAAMTGASYEDISNIFTTVAGNGRLMSEQLLQFSSRGLNVAAALGKQLGKSEKEIRDMVSDGKIDFEMFANAMNDAFGEHATEAGKTFTGSMANMKAALARIGADFFTPWIQQQDDAEGRLTNLVDLFNALRDTFDILHVAVAPVIKEFNDFALGGVMDSLVGTIKAWNEEHKILKDDKGNTKGLAKEIGGLFNILEPLKNVLEGIIKVVKEIVKTGAELLKVIGNALDSSELLTNIGDVLVGILQRIQNGIKNVDDVVDRLFNGLSSLVKLVGGKLLGAWDSFKSAFDGDSALKNISDLLDIILSGVLIKMVNNFSKLFQSISVKTVKFQGIFHALKGDAVAFFNNIGVAVTNSVIKKELPGLLSSLLTTMQQYQSILKAKAIKEIAVAIGILAGSLYVLSSIDTEKLILAITALEIVMWTFLAAWLKYDAAVKGMNLKNAFAGGNILDALGWNAAINYMAVAGSMIAMATAIAILAGAVKKLGELDFSQLAKGLGGVGALMVAMVLVTREMGAVKGVGAGAAATIFAFGLAVRLMAGSVIALAKLNPDQLVLGLAGLTWILGEVVGVMTYLAGLQAKSASVLAAAGAMVILSLAINTLAIAVRLMGGMDLTTLAKGLGAVTLLMVALALVMERLVESARGLGLFAMIDYMASFAIALIGLSLAIAVLSVSVKIMSTIPIPNLIFGMLAVMSLIAGIMGIAKIMKNGLGLIAAGAGLILIASGLVIIAAAMKMVASLNIDELINSILAVSAFLTTVLLLTNMSSLGGAVSLLLVSAGLLALAGAFKIMASIDISSLVKSMGAFVLVLGGFVALGLILGPTLLVISPALTAFGVALIAVGGGILLVGLGLTALSGGLISFGATLGGVMAILTGLVVKALNLLGDFWKSVGNIVKGLWKTVVNAVKSMWESVKKYAKQIAHDFKAIWPDIKKAASKAWKDLVSSFKQIGKQLGQAVREAGRNAVAKFNELKEKWRQAGRDAIQGIINGFKEKVRAAADAVSGLGSTILSSLKSKLGIKSPSREFKAIAGYSVEGFCQGIGNGTKAVTDAMDSMGENAMDSLSGVLNEINETADLDPVIRPVMDLSEIQNGVGTLNSMMNDTQAANINASMRASVSRDERMLNDLVNKLQDSLVEINDENNDKTVIEVPVVIDGREVARASAPYNKKELDRIERRNSRMRGVTT